MSAYSNGRGNQILSLTGNSANTNSDLPDHIPSLPQVGQELENYFLVSRQIEAALIQERSQLRKARDEFRELQVRHSRLSSETESKLREFAAREDRLNAQLVAHQHDEKSLRDQVAELSRQVEGVQEEKKKVEFNSELLKANIDYLKQREISVKEFHAVRDELQRYKDAWSKVVVMERKAKQMLPELEQAKKKNEELAAALETEKRRTASLEQLLSREKREKQAALSCLHSTESKIAQKNREVEQLKNTLEKEAAEYSPSLEHMGLELKF